MNSILVVDTSTFTNPDSYKKYGRTSELAIEVFVKKYSSFSIFITPSCYAELEKVVDFTKIPESTKMFITIQAPNRNQIMINSNVLYQLVTDFRKRGDSALKYHCALISEVYYIQPQKKEKGKPNPETNFIQRMRDNQRHHLRDGFLDSGPDLDTILLAKELGGKIVSADQGMLHWADVMGVQRTIPNNDKSKKIEPVKKTKPKSKSKPKTSSE